MNPLRQWQGPGSPRNRAPSLAVLLLRYSWFASVGVRWFTSVGVR